MKKTIKVAKATILREFKAELPSWIIAGFALAFCGLVLVAYIARHQ